MLKIILIPILILSIFGGGTYTYLHIKNTKDEPSKVATSSSASQQETPPKGAEGGTKTNPAIPVTRTTAETLNEISGGFKKNK